MDMDDLAAGETMERRIYLIRGHRVMLDRRLAELYNVPVKALNRAVKRNRERFPDDFMFQLTIKEWENLKRQIGASSWGGDRRALPYAFTEHGVAMLSSVLRSKRAIEVNLVIIRAFMRLRKLSASRKNLAEKLAELEQKINSHDADIQRLFDAIRELEPAPEEPRRPIGFRP